MPEYPVYTLQQLGQVLRNARKASGKTQSAAGAEVGVLTKTISALETKPGASTVASLFKLLSALNMELVLKPKHPGTGTRVGKTKSLKADW